MRNKNHTRSNAETEDGDEDDMEFTAELQPGPSICDVWADNFDQALSCICALAQQYPVIAIDTQFPGNCVRRQHLSQDHSPEDIDYQLVWHNVETTKLIQIGISLADNTGTLPSPSTWQFHLRFDLQQETSVTESIDLLKEAGIPFDRLSKEGIAHSRFAEGFISSGLILNKALKWVVFHGCYDFAYLLRLLRDEPLPRKPEDFYKSIHIYFPSICDLKEVIKTDQSFKDSGLNSVAAKVGCSRIGPNHQAGSDSLLTLKTYFKLHNLLGQDPFEKTLDIIYGIARPRSKVQYPTFMGSLGQNGPLYRYLDYQNGGLQWSQYYTPSQWGFNSRA